MAEEKKVDAKKPEKIGDSVEIDLGTKEVILGNEKYTGVVKVPPVLADQIRAILPFAKSKK